MKSKVSPEVEAVRRGLGIHTWGMDIYKIKERLGKMILQINALAGFEASIRAEVNRRVAILSDDLGDEIDALNRRMDTYGERLAAMETRPEPVRYGSISDALSHSPMPGPDTQRSVTTGLKGFQNEEHRFAGTPRPPCPCE